MLIHWAALMAGPSRTAHPTALSRLSQRQLAAQSQFLVYIEAFMIFFLPLVVLG